MGEENIEIVIEMISHNQEYNSSIGLVYSATWIFPQRILPQTQTNLSNIQ